MKTKSILGKLGMFISLILLTSKSFGQVCTPNPIYTGDGIWPDTIVNMSPACIGAPYQMDFTINVPDDTIISGFTFIIDSVILNSISGLPAGFTYSCNPSSCRFLGNASGCFIVAGNPTVPLTGSYNLTINTTVYAHNSLLGNQSVPQSFGGYDLHIGSNPSLGTNSNDASCGSSDGSAWVLATGTAPFTYLWSTSSTNDTINNIPAGLYSVTVTDNIGCTATANAIVLNPGAPDIDSTTTTNPLCFGDTDGSASVFASGGTPTYTYLWSSGGSAATENNLGMGTYTVTVTDVSNCQTQTTVNITTPSAIGTSTSVTPETCVGCNDGSASVLTSGGTPGYTYNWTPSGGTGATANGLAAGTYTITVTDSVGCVATNTAVVYSTASIDDQGAGLWNIYPNPVTDQLIINNTGTSGIVTIALYDISGRLLISTKYSDELYRLDMTLMEKGSYILQVNSDDQKRAFRVLKQ